MNSMQADPRGSDDNRSWMTDEIAATVHLAFAFDIGDEVDLDRARLILQGEPGQLPRRRRTPESIRYRPAPIRVELDPAGIALPGDPSLVPPAPGRADALRFRRDLVVCPFSPEDLAAGSSRSGRPAGGAGCTDRGRAAAARPLARTDQARRLRLRGQRPERGIHRLSALGEPARLARAPLRLDRRTRPARVRALEPRRNSRGHPPEPLLHAERPGRARLGRRRGRRHRLRRHARSHRVRQRAAPRISPYRRPARRSTRSRLSADSPGKAPAVVPTRLAASPRRQCARSASSKSRPPASSNGSTTP